MMNRLLPSTLLVLLALALTCSGTIETIRNDPGRTASGVTITFSARVRITSFDESVFPEQHPSGRDSEFTFSGGSLSPNGRFRVSWTPSTAEIEEVEWLRGSTASPLSTPASQTPMTYEQIMAEIAEYPGPNEPLYVPGPDEAIWLTDLEGHADIYDNDSIKINYADWFDRGQITKVEVYRNGIKMRFLPDMFDVLTNAQMKAFDGNPLESTPASSHSDHAIHGYSFEFAIHGASNLVLGTLAVEANSGIQIPSSLPLYAHLDSNWVLDAFHWNGMTDQQLLGLLQAFKSAGFNGIQLDTNWFVETGTSSEVVPIYQLEPIETHPWFRTETESELVRLLDLANSLSLDVELRIQLYVCNSGKSEEIQYRSEIQPRNVSLFFESLGDVAVDLATIAEAKGVDTFTPMVELDSLERHDAEIRHLLDRIDRVFSGRLAVNQATHHYVFRSQSYFEANCGEFWDWRDEEGLPLIISMNCWNPPLETQDDQRWSVLLEKMADIWNPVVVHFRERFPENPLVFGEIGAYAFDGHARGGALPPDIFDPARAHRYRDDQEFVETYAAYVAASYAMGLDGVALWSWAPSSLLPSRNDWYRFPNLNHIASLIE